MAAIIALFRDEQEAQQVIRQLVLESAIQSITFLHGHDHHAMPGHPDSSISDALHRQGFAAEQCASCMQALGDGRAAVLLECDDAADMLVALHSYGVRNYHMA
ncbi:hypothetical protein G3578_04390 [Brevibacillus sp. SYP-B805]|uniref:hypothetical protein n=1 Tax=Brevibacillus sp. SYP-B805 TaxID=1578199 RepID=UPI0013ECBACF|nr:hypothetical protein [Brevibacillus sp. SYP-B805]NGQ94415.1 hypothetical protein [Brevibacillus sp. SYP-B805]